MTMPATRLRPAFLGARHVDAAAPHLSVDGMTERGPNLSHWPGNRTPRRYKADLSTGICLTFARAPADEQRAFLGTAELVVNDHYDTDGFLSMLAVTRPDVAFAAEELCLLGAATGDYQAYHTRRSFAVDRIVVNLARDGSPVADRFAHLTGADRSDARYSWLIENAERVLHDPESLAGCWLDDWRATTDELTRCRAGALERELVPHVGLGVVTTAMPIRRLVLNTLAGAWRVLHVLPVATGGGRYRYHDRTESWFEVVTFSPLPRVDLRPLAARLQELEGSTVPAARWCADPPTEPVPELWFGADEPQAYGEVTRTLAESRLPPQRVRDVLVDHLAGAAT